MNNKKSMRLILWSLQITVILMIGSIAAISAQAQCPSPVQQNNQVAARMGQTIMNLRAGGATVTCSGLNTPNFTVTIQYPNGFWSWIRMSDNGSTNTTIWDPATGQTTTFYYTWSGSQAGLIIDAGNGLLDAGDGWYSIWDPLGNPFSAAIEDPLNALTLWTAVIQNPDAGGDYRVPPAPIAVEGGIY